MKYIPKKIPEGINSSKDHPLKEFAILIAGFAALIGAAFLALGYAADKMAERITYEQEVRWFSNINLLKMLEIDNLKKVTEEPSNLKDLVQRLWQPYREKTGVDLQVGVLFQSTPNAFMGPGGNMGVTNGLLAMVETENELAFVVCHEIGHFYNRHVIKAIGRGLAVAGFITFIGLGEDTTAQILTAGFNFAQLTFSRTQEEDADRFALQCMHEEYGHVADYQKFFEKTREHPELKHMNKIPHYLSTHPISEDRIRLMKAEITTKGFTATGEVTPWEGLKSAESDKDTPQTNGE